METRESPSEPGQRQDGGPPICAIGASAGGIEALQALFGALPTDLGFAYVVVVHLAVDHPSHLPEILAQRTAMPVQGVHATTLLEADHVYTNVPGHGLFLVDGAVTSRPFAADGPRWTPIDAFLQSIVAGPARDTAVLILSGAGRDGTLGARAVKAAGGLVLVQDPAEAAYAPMPESVRGAGAADVVAPVAELIGRLAALARERRTPPPPPAAADLGPLLRLLRLRTGHDLATYKPATVLRRVARRRQVTRCRDLAAYTDHVRDHPEEADHLFRDLLISVTSFFRDPNAFTALAERALPPLFERLGEDEPLRAWVIGCATGEEAYSLAMLLLEAREHRRTSTPIQIFASDLDDDALAIAREGRYPKSIAADLAPDRLHRFFKESDDSFTVSKTVRELVLFTRHDLLQDPPFLRLDLISCRNLLIYLHRDTQQQLAGLFHYALKPGGVLFLGSAESVDAPELFEIVQREARIHRARPHGGPTLPRLPDMPAALARPPTAPAPSVAPARPDGGAESHLAALEQAAPPSVLVDDSENVLHLSPTAGRFLMPSAGPVSTALGVLVRPELRVDVENGLERALERGEPTVTLPLVVDFEGAARRVVLHVRPAPAEADGAARALVMFIDGGPAAPAAASTDAAAAVSAGLVQDLRDELEATRARLQASRAQQQQTVQELRAANEELQSINEEYRSTSEELETSKEELQSMNEELQTVNAELRSKLDSISSANSDLQNLMQATEIGTLFLDTGLRIRMFTPRITDHVKLTDADVGRSITDFAHRLVDIDVERDAAVVLRELAPVEREVATVDGRWLTMRLRPYRTVDDRIDGVVVTFVDVTERRAAEAKLRASEEKYRALFESIGDGVLVAEILRDEQGRAVDLYYLDLNPAGLAIVPSPLVGRRLSEVRPAFEAYWWEIPARVARTGEPERHELYAGPLARWYEIYVWRLDAETDRVAILFRDTTERRRALDALEATRDLLEIATAASGLGWITVDMAHGTVRSDQRARELLGLTQAEIALAKFRARLHDDDRATVERELEARARDGECFDIHARVRTGDGRERRVRLTGVFERAGEPRTARASALVGDADGDRALPRG